MVFRGLGCVFSPFGVFASPIWFGLVVWYPVCTRSFNTPSLCLLIN